MTTTLERLRAKSKKTWTETIDGDEYHFRSLTSLERAQIEMTGIRLSKEGEIEADPDLSTHSRKIWMIIAYQLVESDGTQVFGSVEEVSSLDHDTLDLLFKACKFKVSGGEKEAEKNSN